MYVEAMLCMIIMNMVIYDEIWSYECMRELGCLMWYLALNMIIGFYSLHCTNIAWVIYMLGWYYVGLDYDAYFVCILNLLGKKNVLTKCPFMHVSMVFMHSNHT